MTFSLRRVRTERLILIARPACADIQERRRELRLFAVLYDLIESFTVNVRLDLRPEWKVVGKLNFSRV